MWDFVFLSWFGGLLERVERLGISWFSVAEVVQKRVRLTKLFSPAQTSLQARLIDTPPSKHLIVRIPIWFSVW